MLRGKFQLKSVRIISLLFCGLICFNFLMMESRTGLGYTSLSDQQITSIIAQIPRETAGQASNEEWYNIQYEMVIISTPSFLNESNRYAAWQKLRGIPAVVVSNYGDFPGVDQPEQIRNAIKWYYDRYPIQWVLLMGDTNILPIRYIYNPDCAEVPGSFEAMGSTTIKPTDYYYADLTGNWNIDGDGNWGERAKYNSMTEEDEWDWETEVYVGRIPAESETELRNVLDKTISYEQGVGAGSWMNRYLATSGISDYPYAKDKNGEDEAALNQYIIDNIVGHHMNWAHFYENTSYYTVPYITNRTFPISRYTIRNLVQEGFSLGTWAGHGAPSYFQSIPMGRSFDISDIATLTNKNRYSLLYSDACSTNMYDQEGSVGEEFILKPNAGGIGFIGAMRISWYWPNDTDFEILNRGLLKAFMQAMFNQGYYQQGKALYESKQLYRENSWSTQLEDDYAYWETERKVLLSYMLLGDPSLDLYTENPSQFLLPFNPWTDYYEGTLVKTQIVDQSWNPVPYARIAIASQDGELYNAFTADWNGNVIISLPVEANNYTYTLSAHNMIYNQGEFSVIQDEISPVFNADLKVSPTQPSVNEEISISIGLTDEDSGIQDTYILLTTDEFATFTAYPMQHQAGSDQYQSTLPLLEPNQYQFFLVTFDYAGNQEVYLPSETDATISIPIPAEFYLLVVINIGVLIGIGIVVTLLVRKIRFVQ